MNIPNATVTEVKTLLIPVISTKHLPMSECLTPEPPGTRFAKVPGWGGGFLNLLIPINHVPEKDKWLIPIIQWLKENYGDDSTWVLFDCDGDIVESLPVYR